MWLPNTTLNSDRMRLWHVTKQKGRKKMEETSVVGIQKVMAYNMLASY